MPRKKPKKRRMAITFMNAGAFITSVLTTLDIALPSTGSVGNPMFLEIHTKYSGSFPQTPDGWELIGQAVGGNGAPGNDSGNLVLSVFRAFVTGTLSGNITVTMNGTPNTNMGRILQYQSSVAGTWDIETVYGIDNTAGTDWEVTGTSNLGLQVDDMLLSVSSVNGNLSTNFISEDFSQSGIVFGLGQEIGDNPSTSGSDSAMVQFQRPVATGSSTSIPRYVMTGNGSGANSPTGVTIFIRLRVVTGNTYEDSLSIGKNVSIAIPEQLDINPTLSIGKSLSYTDEPQRGISFLTGFEHGNIRNRNGGVVIPGANSTVQSTVKHSGDYALRLAPTESTSSYYIYPFPPEEQRRAVVGRQWFLFESFPTGTVDTFLIPASGTSYNIYFKYDPDPSKLLLSIGNIGPTQQYSNVVLVTGTWYPLDWRGVIQGNILTVDWKVNDLNQPQTIVTGSAGGNFFEGWVLFGNSSGDGQTMTLFVDDFIFSNEVDSYPILITGIQGLRPNADAILNNITDGLEVSDTGVDLDGANPGYALVDENPWGTTLSDYIRQNTSSHFPFVRLGFPDTSQTNIVGVMGSLQYAGAGSDPNQAACFVVDSLGRKFAIWGTDYDLADYSETGTAFGRTFHKSQPVSNPYNGWTQSDVNALTVQLGHGLDSTPNPFWVAILLEVAYQEAQTHEDSISLAKSLAISLAGALGVNVSLSLSRGVSISLSSILSVEAMLMLGRQLAISTSSIGNLQDQIILQKSLNLLLNDVMVMGESISLGKSLAITDLAGLSIDGNIALGKILAITLTPTVDASDSISLAKQVNLAASANGLLVAAMSLAKTLDLSATSQADYQVAISLLRSLAIITSSAVTGAPDTWNEAISLAKSLAISTSAVGLLVGEISLAKQLGIAVDSLASMTDSISLEKQVSIAFLASLLLQSALSLGRIESILTDRSVILNESIGLATSLGISDSTLANLAAQLSLGKTVSLSANVQASFGVDISLGRVLDIQILGGQVYSDDLVLGILQAISTASQLVIFFGDLPARIILNDQVIWLLSIRDRRVDPGGIIRDDSQAEVSLKDVDHV